MGGAAGVFARSCDRLLATYDHTEHWLPMGESSAMQNGHRKSAGSTDGTVWVFGYGSLTWKVDFAYHERAAGHVRGYARRFWQGSTDHRGVPGAVRPAHTLPRPPQGLAVGCCC